MSEETKGGKLFLVSAGIGDPDNMTIRAQKTLELADVVLCMKFTRKQYQDLLKDKEVYDSGHGLFNQMGDPSIARGDEEEIRRIVRQAVASGKTVVVLDFGDPTLYSPQSGYLKEFADLKPVVIPGISSVNAANAALGCEVTGNYDRPVILTEAMRTSDNSEDQMEKLAATGSTLVLFTMRMDIEDVALRLKKQLPGDTPVAIVCHAGFSDGEKVLRANLDTVAACIQEEKPSWDYLLYVRDFLSK